MKKLKLGESKFGLTKACSQGFDATDGKDAGYRVSQDDEQCFQADVMDIKLNVCVYIYIHGKVQFAASQLLHLGVAIKAATLKSNKGKQWSCEGNHFDLLNVNLHDGKE